MALKRKERKLIMNQKIVTYKINDIMLLWQLIELFCKIWKKNMISQKKKRY